MEVVEMSLLGSIGGAIGGLVGGILGSNSSAAKAKRQWEREQSWQEEQIRNAHQWEMEDLKAAGINPALTAGGSGAGGASSPSGTEAISNNGLMQGIATALDAKRVNIEENNSESTGILATAQADQAKATAAKELSENELLQKYGDKKELANLANIYQNTATSAAQAQNLKANINLQQEQANKARAETKELMRIHEIGKMYGKMREEAEILAKKAEQIKAMAAQTQAAAAEQKAYSDINYNSAKTAQLRRIEPLEQKQIDYELQNFDSMTKSFGRKYEDLRPFINDVIDGLLPIRRLFTKK